jgi:molybdopterin-guanine dinucleotide biosynthesis protein B
MHELRGAAEPSLEELLTRLAPCDLVLVEGFKREVRDRLEVYRANCGQTPLVFEDSGIAAVATDDAATFASRADLRCLSVDDEAAVLDYVLTRA